MNNKVFDIVLLIALPASGKSEVRNFLANVEPERLADEFHIGQNLQLDDFPYVFMMRRIDDELEAMGESRIFYPGETPFYDGRDWGTLINLLNEDFHDMRNHNVITPKSAAQLLFDRIDTAALQAGISPRLGLLDSTVRAKLAEKLEAEAAKMLAEKHAGYPDTMDGKTLIIECARGGPVGASMPLTRTCGYQYTIPVFCPEILEKASVLYIWVTPEESRRKNADRADPNDPGSNLHHSTPMAVMLEDYGCDDLRYMVSQSQKQNTLCIEAHGKSWELPVGIFDNREDKTSFLRGEKETWGELQLEEFSAAIKQATDSMWNA